MKKRVMILGMGLIFLMSLSACTTTSAVKPADTAMVPVQPRPYAIQPGDAMDIKFFYNPELNETITVRPDGFISLQLIDEVKAAGMTPPQLNKLLTDAYSRELKRPVITVILRSFAGQRIFVGGEVTQQGLIPMTSGMTALQAVFQAGGFRETALPEETLVIRKGEDNQPLPIRVDLAAASQTGQGSNFALQADDVIFVPKSAIAKANLFVRQYIEQLFLFRGVSLGFNWELHSDSNN